MPRRTFWFTAGATAGFGGAMWVRRQVLHTVQRYAPDQVQADLADSVRRLGSDLRAAVTEGRSAMADREAELRSALRPGGPPTDHVATAAGATPVGPGADPADGAATVAPRPGAPGSAASDRRARRGRAAGRRRSRRAHLS
jgi:hypothetical protein